MVQGGGVCFAARNVAQRLKDALDRKQHDSIVRPVSVASPCVDACEQAMPLSATSLHSRLMIVSCARPK
jgi:hypothetical protein